MLQPLRWIYSSLVCCVLLPTYTVSAQAPTVQWERSFGGSQADVLNTVQATLDGGFILGGASSSGVSGDRSQPNQGVASDYWIVKLAATGTKEWDRRFGGAEIDELWSVLQAADGGYLLGGTSFSGIGGDKTQAGQGAFDYWVVKVDAQGNKQWDRAYGGSEGETLRSMQQTTDGGYILGGYSSSGISGDKTQPNQAGPAFLNSTDYWVIKIDAQGNKQWDRTFGGNATEFFSELQQTTDGGYILGGASLSDASGDRTDALKGVRDYWIVKIDAQGNKQWDRAFGGSGTNAMRRVRQTADGGYMLCGESTSGISGDKTEPSKGESDIWLVKLDAAGAKQWDRTIGGALGDVGYAVQQTRDGGYAIGGSSVSTISGDKTEPPRGGGDYWVVKLNAQGAKLWDRTLGGSQADQVYSLQQLVDGSYIIGGTSASGATGDKSQPSQGSSDYWVIKLNSESLPMSTSKRFSSHQLAVYPNPAHDAVRIQWPASAVTRTGWHLRLVDALGRVVLQKQVDYSNTGEFRIAVRRYPPGMYILQMEGPEGAVYSQRLAIN